MKFEPKISGTTVTDFGEIKTSPAICGDIVTLKHINTLKNADAVNWIFEHYDMWSLNPDKADGANWGAVMKYDDILKVSILENHPDKAEELRAHFGDNWMNHYIRFGH